MAYFRCNQIALIDKTASGAVASFSDGIGGVPFTDITAEIVPLQDGTGDPGPENVRTIHGYTGVNVTRTGKNLFNGTNVINAYVSTTIVANSATRTCWIECKPNTVYTISKVLSARFGVAYTKEFPASGVTVYNATSKNDQTSITLSTGADAKYLVAYVYHSPFDTLTPEEIIASVQIELGRTATEYEQFRGTTYSVTWQTEAGEIVDGTIDIVSGLLTAMHVKQVYRGDNLDTLSLSYGQAAEGYTHMYFGINNTPLGKNFGQQLHTKSNMGVITNAQSSSIPSSEGFAVLNITNPDRLIVYWYVNLTWASANDFKTWLNSNPFELYYQLATPQTYQLTPKEVKTLLGVNNVFNDTNGNTEVTYKAKP